MNKFAKVLGLALILGVVGLSATSPVQATMPLQASEVEPVQAGVAWQCHVDSRVNAYIRVYVNGVYRGTLAPYGDIFPLVGDAPHQITSLYAVADDGRTWRRTMTSTGNDFHWILHP